MPRRRSDGPDNFPGDTRELLVSYSGHLDVRIWVRSGLESFGSVLDSVEPRDLPISEGLCHDLEAQQDEFGPRWDLPWPAPTLAQRRRGWLLARRLAEELWDLEVYWRDVGSGGKYLPVFESPAPR